MNAARAVCCLSALWSQMPLIVLALIPSSIDGLTILWLCFSDHARLKRWEAWLAHASSRSTVPRATREPPASVPATAFCFCFASSGPYKPTNLSPYEVTLTL